MRRLYQWAVYSIVAGAGFFIGEKLLKWYHDLWSLGTRHIYGLDDLGIHLHLRDYWLPKLQGLLTALAPPCTLFGFATLVYLKWVCRDPVTRYHPAPPPLNDPILQLQQIFLALTLFFGSLDDLLELSFEILTMLSFLSAITSIYFYYIYVRRKG